MNMKKISLILLFSLCLFTRCVDERPQPNFCIECEINGMSRSAADIRLSEIYQALEKIATSVTCNDASEWKFVAFGSKACGGPAGYLPYHKSIIVKDFLERVANYSALQNAYNKKWNVISDCSIVQMPKGVECVDGKAKLL